jgi:hypothetical protein
MTKIEVKIKYVPEQILRINEIVSKLDLGIEGMAVTEYWTITTTSEVDDEYIRGLSNVLAGGIEKTGGECLVVEVVEIAAV